MANAMGVAVDIDVANDIVDDDGDAVDVDVTDITKSIDNVRAFLQPHVNCTYTISHEAFRDVVRILQNHPVWGTRLADIVGLRVRRSRLNKALQLQLMTNRMWFTVSWRECARRTRARRRDALPTVEHRLTSAMRDAVRRQLVQWRKLQFGRPHCAQCRRFGGLQVDHVSPSFSDLKTMFLLLECDSERVPPTEFALRAASGSSIFRKEDQAFKRRWQQFHKERATFQFLCPMCNRKKSNR